MRRRAIGLVVALASVRAFADPVPTAEQLYRDGQAAYDQGRYGDALAAWQRSYELSHLPALHYNLGQAYRLRAVPGDCARAREQYERFVQATEQSPQRTLAEGYVAQLMSCTEPALSPGSDAATGQELQTPLRSREIAAAAIGAGGIVLLATGIYFSHHAASLGDEVTNACATSCTWSAWKGTDAAGHRDAALGWTFDALGVAALAGGASLYWFGVREPEIQVVPVATQPHSRGAVLSWSHVW